MMRAVRRVGAGMAVVLLAPGLLAGCGGGRAGRDGRLRVVAAENVWGDVAGQLGGGHVSVTSIISDPNTDPHLYESTAADAAAVARAGVVVENGAGYDDFVSRLLGAGATSDRHVVSVQAALGAAGADLNPHFWYDITRVPTVAAAIDAALVRADPAHGADYRANLTRFDASLAPVEADISTIRSRYPGAPVAYTERVPGYLLADAGLRVATPPGFAAAIEDGNEPGPADSRAMDDLITGRRVRVLLYNTQTVSPVTRHVRDLTAAAGIPVVGVSETMPAGAHYQAWQQAQVAALLAALGTNR